MRLADYFVQGRRHWIRLHEKGGKLHFLPCRHNLDDYLAEYIATGGIAVDVKGPLFRSVAAKRGQALSCKALLQANAYKMIQRRAEAYFQVWRETATKRMRAKLAELTQALRSRMHESVPETGKWLQRMVKGTANITRRRATSAR